jgi:hypothetical protein
MEQTETFFIQQLKEKLEVKIGFQILHFHDCRFFSDLLKQEKITVSSHTLARLFGILKDNHRPYNSTLNLLALYLGFRNFSIFCSEIKSSNSNLLINPACFKSGDFSYIALELAILSNDWKNLQFILESYDFRNSLEKNQVVEFLGNAVRNHKKKGEFLAALSEIENGRILFYESFVDEDDFENYYSDSLSKYY